MEAAEVNSPSLTGRGDVVTNARRSSVHCLLFCHSFVFTGNSSPASFRKMLLHERISSDEVSNIFAHGECLETGMPHDDLTKLLRSVLLVPVIFFDEMRGECSEIRLCPAAISFVAKLVPRSDSHRSITLFILVGSLSGHD
jgi:hypothetical protein